MSNRFEPHSSTLVNLVEKYIAQKRDGELVDQNYFENELRKLGKSQDQINDLIIEMDDDADKELLAGEGLKRSNKIFTFGLILGILGMVFTFAWAFFRLLDFGLSIHEPTSEDFQLVRGFQIIYFKI